VRAPTYRFCGEMSAAASGYALHLAVLPPTSADLDDFEFGRRVYQTQSRFYSAQPQYSEWYISAKTKDDPVLIKPLAARYINHTRNVTPQRLRDDFIIRARTI
jgi:hypothetical protein